MQKAHITEKKIPKRSKESLAEAEGSSRKVTEKSTKVPLAYEKTRENSRIRWSLVMAGDYGWRKIKLLCPSVSKTIDWVAWNDQKLDFRSMAAAFGLEPSTVKLNGHFISRDIDLVAYCVTWRSLLAFFSAKGLSTGKDDADALLVDGKLSKVGTKRAYSDPHEDLTCNDLGLIRNKKLKDKRSVGEPLVSTCNKRKLFSEDTHSLKKLKLNMDASFDVAGRQSGVSKTPLKCLKRTREDDMIASCK